MTPLAWSVVFISTLLLESHLKLTFPSQVGSFVFRKDHNVLFSIISKLLGCDEAYLLSSFYEIVKTGTIKTMYFHVKTQGSATH